MAISSPLPTSERTLTSYQDEKNNQPPKSRLLWNKSSFYVNGQHLITVHDDAFDKGKVGLVAGTVEGADLIKVAFDNLHVYGPSR